MVRRGWTVCSLVLFVLIATPAAAQYDSPAWRRVLFGATTTGPFWTTHATACPGNVAAPPGSFCVDLDDATVWKKNTGTGTSGWVNFSSAGGGSGTVTSVDLSMPALFSVAGGPITTAGSFTVSLATQLANRVFAGPTSGGAAVPTMRALVAADIPSLGTANLTDGSILFADLAQNSAAVGDVPTWTVSGWAAQAPPSSAGGAPTGASYVMLGLNGTTTSERVLTPGAGILVGDTGANGTVTISAVSPTGGATQTTFLVNGGQVVWESAYQFRVSAAQYYISGVLYSSAEQVVTLGAADATLDRIDVIAVNDAGSVVVIAGTPAAQPSEPDVDPGTQLKLTIVYVSAASTAPATVTNETVYLENAGAGAEWNWTTSGSGFTLNSTAQPRTGTINIEGTAVAAAAYGQGQRGSGTVDINTYSQLVFYLRSKATWNNNRGLRVQFLSSGVLKGNAVSITRSGSFGFDSSNTGAYQQVAIPITQFAIPSGTTVNQLRFVDFGGSIGFYIDDIVLQGGGSTGTTTSGITQAQADARYAKLGLASLSGLTMPTARLLGRTTASTGAIEDITVGAGLNFTGGVLSSTTASRTAAISLTIDGAGSAITTGVKGFVTVPQSCTITSVRVLSTDAASTAGSIVVDIWRDSYTNYPPTVADTITASAKPTLSSANKSNDATLTGWTTALTAGDILGFKVDSATTVTRVTVTLIVSVP